MCPVIRRRTGHDAVVVVRKALRFHEGLVATIRAARPVRKPRTFAIEGSDDRLRIHSCDVIRSIAPIGNFFGMIERPALDAGTVAHICTCNRVFALEPDGHFLIGGSETSTVAAVAVAVELAVPRPGRQPDFEVDVQVAPRCPRPSPPTNTEPFGD